ncbi:unnamed protein product [Nezara viridula]|uniref:Uncharacterized protein n=1 Tax=Nezara viridula TaxID=85310 RepID=A0A9P0H6E4_NEZVI|nr:unnamed protein product [Nezara viridula]
MGDEHKVLTLVVPGVLSSLGGLGRGHHFPDNSLPPCHEHHWGRRVTGLLRASFLTSPRGVETQVHGRIFTTLPHPPPPTHQFTGKWNLYRGGKGEISNSYNKQWIPNTLNRIKKYML